MGSTTIHVGPLLGVVLVVFAAVAAGAAYTGRLPVARATVTASMRAVVQLTAVSLVIVAVLRSGWLTTGRKTKQFETEFAAYLGHCHALAVNSCTAALHLALDAIGVIRGDAVVVPTMTFAATQS